MLLGGCATHYSGEVNRDPYGFFFGAWHGFILPYSLVGSFLSWLLSLLGIELLANVQLVGQPNSGFFYYFGFALGLISYGGSAGRR